MAATGRVATDVTMDVADMKLGSQQAAQSLKKIASEALKTNEKLKSLIFFEKLKLGFAGITKAIGSCLRAFNALFNVIKNPVSQIPFLSGFVGFADSVVQGTLQTYNLSRAIGATVNEMQALSLAAEKFGLEVSTLYEPISKLPRKIQEAAAGFGDSASVFASLPGLDLAALREQRPFEQLKTVADALNNVNDLNQRLFLMTKIFEESGPKFQQLFAAGSKGIEEFEQLVKDLGLTLEDVDIAKFRELDWLSTQLSRSWGAIVRDALLEVSPSMIKFMTVLKELLKDKGFREAITESITNLFSALGVIFMDFLNSALAFVGGIDNIVKFILKTTEVIKLIAENISAILISPGFWAARKLYASTQPQKDPTQSFADNLGIDIDVLKELIAVIKKNMEELKLPENKPDWKLPMVEVAKALNKFAEKVTYSVFGGQGGQSSQAGALPLLGTQAGAELMLANLESGYREPKEVVLLKRIEKVLIKIEQQPDLVVGVNGAL